MVTKVMETAPPTRKLFIRSGSRKAAMYASVCGPAPKTHAMYLPRASPTNAEIIVEAASSTEAERALCACEGLSSPSPRCHHERRDGGGSAPVLATGCGGS